MDNEKADWYFTILSNTVFISALVVTEYDFVVLQRMMKSLEGIALVKYSARDFFRTLLVSSSGWLRSSFKKRTR
jgi:hypothetical protein